MKKTYLHKYLPSLIIVLTILAVLAVGSWQIIAYNDFVANSAKRIVKVESLYPHGSDRLGRYYHLQLRPANYYKLSASELAQLTAVEQAPRRRGHRPPIYLILTDDHRQIDGIAAMQTQEPESGIYITSTQYWVMTKDEAELGTDTVTVAADSAKVEDKKSAKVLAFNWPVSRFYVPGNWPEQFGQMLAEASKRGEVSAQCAIAEGRIVWLDLYLNGEPASELVKRQSQQD